VLLRLVWCCATWFQPHNTHCSHSLDVQVFSSFICHDTDLDTQLTELQSEGNLLPTLHAWHSASYAGVARAFIAHGDQGQAGGLAQSRLSVGPSPSSRSFEPAYHHGNHAQSMLSCRGMVRRKRRPMNEPKQGLIPNRSLEKTFSRGHHGSDRSRHMGAKLETINRVSEAA
jgi:hypothetical protein